MQRRVVIARRLIILQLKHRQIEVGSDGAEGPFAGHPTLIEGDGAAIRAGLLVQERLAHAEDGLMQGLVEDGHDLPADIDGIGHVDDLVEEVGQAGGDDGFAVSRRSVQHHGAPGIDCRQDFPDDSWWQYNILELRGQVLDAGEFVVNGLFSDLTLEGQQRHRRRAHILVLLERLMREVTPGLGRFVMNVLKQAAHGARAERLDEFLQRDAAEQVLHHMRRQAQGAGDIGRGRPALVAHEFEEQEGELCFRDAGIGDGAGRFRGAGFQGRSHVGELFGGQRPHIDEDFPKPAAGLTLLFERGIDGGDGNQPAPNE